MFDFLAGVALFAVAWLFLSAWPDALSRRAAVLVWFEGSGPLKCMAPRTRWPVLWNVLGYFVCIWGAFVLVLALTPTFVPSYTVRGFHLVLAGIGAWIVAWAFFVFGTYPHLRSLDDPDAMSMQLVSRRATVCPQNFAIQEVDLLSSATSAISVLVSVVCWVRDTRPDSSGEFWTSSTVWPSPAVNFSSSGAIQAVLAQTCARGTAPELHVSSRMWNSTMYYSYDIGTPSEAGEGWAIMSDWWFLILRLDQWYAILWVLSVSLLFQCDRARRNRVLCAPGAIYDPETPDYTRWAEYALTSPVQVYIVALNLSRKQDELLWMLMGTQALLMLQGYLIELCLYIKWSIAEPPAVLARGAAMHGWPGPGPKLDPAGRGVMLAHLPAESHLFRVGCTAAAPADKPPADVSISYRSIVFLLVSAFQWHFMIWRVLLEAFFRSEKQFNQCQEQKVPEWVRWILIVQFTLFTLFGLVQLHMVLVMRRHNACCIWRGGSMCYSILSVTAKTTLDILFIAGTVMKE